MSHSYVSNLMHCTFSTKERYPFIDLQLESNLWPYIGGIARTNRMKALAIGGTVDNLHALLSLPSVMSFAKAVQLIKGGSSKWVHDTFPKYKKFEWQEGYGAFSVSASQVKRTIAYIENQKEHHRKRQALCRLRLALCVPLASAVRFTDYLSISYLSPTDESVGYYHPSASRTRTLSFDSIPA